MGDPVLADIPTLPRTIAVLPFFAGGRHPKPDLVGRCTAAGIEKIPGSELIGRVRELSLGLTALGLDRGDRVAILSESRPEWLLTDFAVLAAGAVVVPIYPTLSNEQVAFILRDADVRLAVVSNATQLAKVLAAAPSVPGLQAVIVIDPPDEGSAADPASDGSSRAVAVSSWREACAAGHQAMRDGWGVAREFQERAQAVAPEDLATIIYTSGTTGEPKGVMLTHANLVANLDGINQVLDLRHDDVALSFLPLCHGLERMVSYIYMVTGVSMIFAESLDTVARDLAIVRPTVMSGVPRVFEKLHARILATGQAATGLRRRNFDKAVRTAGARGRRLASGQSLWPWLSLKSRVAERFVYGRVRAGLGGRLRFTVSGSAPLARDIGEFFYGLGLPVLEGLGLTETAPVIAVMPLDAVRFGTVGPPLPNVEVRMAEDGEILTRGPNVMAGYYRRPDETAAVMRDGWFHTGDIGELDDAGYLWITDRKKELLVTSGGKKIAPQPIEAALRRHPLVAEAVVIGDRRHFVAALLVPDFSALAERLGATTSAAEPDARRALLDRHDARALFQSVVDEVNGAMARFEQVKQFALLDQAFSMGTGELTPTLKVKRRVIEERYRTEIETLYS
jgi:long-chain acyl-CoA synthetase